RAIKKPSVSLAWGHSWIEAALWDMPNLSANSEPQANDNGLGSKQTRVPDSSSRNHTAFSIVFGLAWLELLSGAEAREGVPSV
ncbi:hypothetical protein SARC_13214, partial [Sphaeroforma arctica JP610]